MNACGLAKTPSRISPGYGFGPAGRARQNNFQAAGVASQYLRGDGAASEYVGLTDHQGRTFRKWAERHQLPYALIGTVRTYRKSDIDRLWLQTAFNLPLQNRTVA